MKDGDSMISDIYTSFVKCAKGIPGFVVGQKEDVPYDITELADEYCKAVDEHDEVKKSQYISALMIRYWHMVAVLYEQSKSARLDVEDITSWLYEAFAKAFSYRSWQNPDKEVSKDPKGAEKVINRCIYSVRNAWYTEFNRNRTKINFKMYSLDANPEDLLADSGKLRHRSGVEKSYLDIIPCNETYVEGGRDLVQKYINAGRIRYAIILDHIMYQDSMISTCRQVKTGELDDEGNPIYIEKYKYKFSAAKLSKALTGISKAHADSFKRYEDYFLNVYTVDKDTFEKAVEYLATTNRTIRSKYVRDVINKVRQSKEELSWLCS